MVNKAQSKEMLNQLAAEMFNLCIGQLENSIEAFLAFNNDLAKRVLHMEDRVNALDLKIDRDCEQFLALQQPGPSDIRFVLALRKIKFDLERIGDYAIGISRYTLVSNILPDKNLVQNLRLDEMFSCTISMLDDINESYTDNNSKRAHKVFKKEQVLNKINNSSISLISKMVKKEVDLIDQLLLLLTVIEKIEGVGNLATNIAQEIIFYREAEVLNNQKEKIG